ncbi:MAG: histone deacetylase family protein [Thermoprotei archaeon]|nr:MAG: histone deacetylase family protein [Thermoprotei archaeon]RLE56783.1 MAG: histone deacetylase family protein [Thermoprotei archaeon]
MRVGVVYSDVYLRHRPHTSHPESPQRLRSVVDELKKRGVLSKVRLIEPEVADERLLELVHDTKYIELVKDFSKRGGGFLDPDTYVCEETYRVALHAVGGVLKAIDLVLSDVFDAVFCLVRPPGHHVGRYGRALGAPTQGFCIFNNVAIAAKYLVNIKKIDRIAIVDFDCHHGNGTQEVFYYDNSVLYMSTHQDPRTIYPGTGYVDEVGAGDGEGYNINIPLPPFSGDDIYRDVVDNIVTPVLSQYRPSIVLMSAGYDAHRRDPITNMNLSVNSFTYLVTKIIEVMRQYTRPKLVLALEGGYGIGLRLGVYSTLCTLLEEECTLEPDTVSDNLTWSYWRRTRSELLRLLSRYWSM